MSSLQSCFRCLRICNLRTPVFAVTNKGNEYSTSSSALQSCPRIPFPSANPLVEFGQQQRWKSEDRRVLIQSMPIKDMGTQGEREMDIDVMNVNRETLFPDADTPNELFEGIKFADLPICHIKVSKNNTIILMTDAAGNRIAYRSCGLEGFKNTRKGTNIAAQTTAITLATMSKEKGVSSIRVAIQGLGPGRMSSVKGLQMGGMKIVAIADQTRISWHPPRARKARRL